MHVNVEIKAIWQPTDGLNEITLNVLQQGIFLRAKARGTRVEEGGDLAIRNKTKSPQVNSTSEKISKIQHKHKQHDTIFTRLYQ